MDGNNLSYEPMDVDLSSHSANAMDISCTGSSGNISIIKTEGPDVFTTDTNFDINPETINTLILCNKQNQNASDRKCIRHQSILFLSLTVLIISIISYKIANFNCCENLNLEVLEYNLITKLYGQTVAVKSVIKALESKENKKILLFYGGTGVGKTYTTSITFENLLSNKNIYHYTMPSFIHTFSSELMLGLLFCKSAILIVDDLRRDDISNIMVPIRDLIIRSEKLSRKLTIILVFNCDIVNGDIFTKCDESFPSELRKSLLDLNAHKYFIKFVSLTEEHLRKCINDELMDRKLSVKNIDKIVKNFNVSLDGCKGVHQKLQNLKSFDL